MASSLSGIHQILATVTKTPELCIDEKESAMLVEGAVNLAAQYNVAPSPKTIAFIQFGSAIAAVYGPRVFMLMNRPANEQLAAI